MVYVRIAGRVELQVAGLSGLGSVGNYNQVATARVSCCGRLHEVPVLTGNALKHWHSVYTAEWYQSAGGKNLNDLCKMGVGYRGYRHDATLDKLEKTLAKNECEAICDLCNDLHGFLIAEEGRSSKRDSLVKVSFMVPVLTQENLEAVGKFAAQHNRVVPESVRAALGKKEAMMLFKQEYASGLYGFNIRLDLANVLKPMFENCKVECVKEENEVSLRRQASVAAVLNLLTGSGSKQARALPIARVVEILAAVSDSPLPNLVHGAYEDYLEKSVDVVRAYVQSIERFGKKVKYRLLYYGQREVAGVELFKDLSSLFSELLKEVK